MVLCVCVYSISSRSRSTDRPLHLTSCGVGVMLHIQMSFVAALQTQTRKYRTLQYLDLAQVSEINRILDPLPPRSPVFLCLFLSLSLSVSSSTPPPPHDWRQSGPAQFHGRASPQQIMVHSTHFGFLFICSHQHQSLSVSSVGERGFKSLTDLPRSLAALPR